MILVVYTSCDRMKNIHNILSHSSQHVEHLKNPIESVRFAVNNPVSLIIVKDDLEFMRGYQLLATINAVRPNICTVLCCSRLNDALEFNAIKAKVDLIIDLSRSDRLNIEKIHQIMDACNINEIIVESNGICLNTQSHTVTKDGREVSLTIREFEFLQYFIKNKNRALSRSEIVAALWDSNVSPIVDGRTVDVHVKRIRDKIGKDALVSVRGIGYKWKG